MHYQVSKDIGTLKILKLSLLTMAQRTEEPAECSVTQVQKDTK